MRTTLEWLVEFTLAIYTDPRMWALLLYATAVTLLAFRAAATDLPRLYIALAALGAILGVAELADRHLNLKVNRFLDSEASSDEW